MESTQSLLGHYKIIKELGRGGMGVVYQAMDTESNRVVAIKMLLDSSMTEINIQRFIREAKISAQMEHPHIVRVYDVKTTPPFYIVMEFIEGRSFSDLLKEQDYPLRKKLEIFQQVCGAVHYGHQQQIIHRDLKPQNIMITEDHIAKVMDFGIAKSLAMQSLRLSRTGQVSGTIQYMSPEQANGQKLDHKTDIYSLGVILYQILTGHTPYQSDNPINILAQLAESKPKSPREWNSSIPKELEAICMKCLKRNPGDRYESAQWLGRDIQAYLKNKSSFGKSTRRTGQGMAQNAKLAGVLIALVLVLIFFGMMYENVEEKDFPATQNPPIANIPPIANPPPIANIPPIATPPFPANTQHVRPSIPDGLNPTGFTFLRNATYTCNGITNTVKEYRHDATGLEFVLIPGGTFAMGSNDGEANEKPVHQVTLSPYLISKTAVTQKVWQKIMGNNPAFFKHGGNYSVENVSWQDCYNFCQKTGLQLPTESQWEYAARGGSSGKWAHGDNESELSRYAWYGKSLENGHFLVAQKSPNAYGVYDMSGNVWEWCQDWYADYSSHAVTDPLGPSSGQDRVVRGGAWCSPAGFCRCAFRDKYDPNQRGGGAGFRVAYSFAK